MDRNLWKKAEELFIQCADLSPAEARTFLNAASADNSEIREAVEGLLRGDARDIDIKQAVGRAAENLAKTQRDQWIGAQIGAYTVTSRIAEGGMGVVYLASRSDQQFEQHVALKLLTGTVATNELHVRFLAERQILANLNHVNIAKLLDGGETENGVPYLVMEYIDGVPLDEYCAVNRLTVDERVVLFTQICSAVQYAHGNLIVHRDIKPSNILVAADGVPKLLDFGIAKMLDVQGLPAGSALTMDGSRLLTPRHASPEQIRGDQITTASDVYSLGLLLYELLCGRFPYDIGDTTRASEIENMIVAEDPLAPSIRIRTAIDSDIICQERRTVAVKLRQELSGDLDTIVLTALRKEPESRYSSARELANDLARASEHRPILARPPTLPYLISRYWQRHRTAAAGLIATVLVTIVGVAVSTVGFFQARESERAAVAEAQNAAATSNFLVGLFRAADPNETAGNELSVSEVLRLGVERIETEMDDTPIVKSDIMETLSSVYKARSDFEESARLLESALQLHEAHVLDDPAGRARLNNELGDLYRILERYEEATYYLERSYAMYDEIGGDITMGRADVANNLALLYGEIDRVDSVGGLLFETLRLRKSLFESPHPDIALSLHNLAWHFSRVGDLAEAEHYAQQALDMRIEIFGEVHPRVAATIGELTHIYYKQARWEDAERTAARSLAIAEQVFDAGHKAVTYQMYSVAIVQHTRGNLRGASELFRKVTAFDRLTYGSEDPNTGFNLKAHAKTLLDLGHYQEAEAALRESRTIFLNATDGRPTQLEDTETLLAYTLLRTGRLGEASELLGIRTTGTDSGPDPDDQSQERRLLHARRLLAHGDAAQAEQLSSSLLQEFAVTSGHHLPLMPQVLHVHGKSQIATGRVAAAVDVLNKALALYEEWWDEGYWRANLVRADLGIALAQNGDTAQGRTLLAHSVAGLKQDLGADHPDTRRAMSLLQQIEASK